MTPPKTLGAEGAKLYRRILADVPEGMELTAVERETVKRAAQLADLAADVSDDLKARGLWVPGSQGQEVFNPAVGKVAQLNSAIASMLAKVKLDPEQSTRAMNRRQRSQLADARRARWPAAHA